VRNLRVAFGQTNPVVGDFDYNLTQIKEMIVSSVDKADLLVFGELAVCGYPLGDLSYRKDIIERSEKTLRELVSFTSQYPDITVAVGHASHAEGKPVANQESFAIAHNSASAIRGGELLGTYHKQLLPNFDVFDDWRNFVPGDHEVFFHINGVRCAIAICQDIWTADSARPAALADAGVELLIVPNGSPFGKDKRAPSRLASPSPTQTSQGVKTSSFLTAAVFCLTRTATWSTRLPCMRGFTYLIIHL